jgi:hypothetical protein
MTINIALATSDALVFGCDSVASTSSFFLDPMDIKWEHDASGNPIQDADGKFTLKFDYGDFQSIVTNAWGGVAKMFQIYPEPSPVVAVTSGMAKLSNRSIASYANEFLAFSIGNPDLGSSEEIAQRFLEFMRTKYDEHYKDSPLPDQLREGPEFLVGGYGVSEDFPSVYRIKVSENTLRKEFGSGGNIGMTGISWNGQSDAVERFLRGHDGQLRSNIEEKLRQDMKSYMERATNEVAAFVNNLLAKLGQSLPEGLKFDLPELKSSALDWEQYGLGIDFANLPMQEAINFVGFLVMLQSGKSRFARGVATVGGRVHIGVVRKGQTFKMLDEPELQHRLTGFSDEL